MYRLFVALLVIATASLAFAEPSPAQVFGKLAKYQQFALSPSGEKLLVLQAAGESYHLGLIDLESQNLSLLMASDPLDFRFNRCRWANEERIVCVLAVQTKRIFDGFSVKTEETRLVAVNADGSDMRQIKPPRFKRLMEVPQQDNILSWIPGEPERFLMAINKESLAFPDIYYVNATTGKFKRAYRSEHGIREWLADPSGQPRIGWGDKAVYRAPGEKKFSTIDTQDLTDAIPLWVDNNSNTVLISTRLGGDRRMVVRVDTLNPTEREVVVEDPRFDVRGWVVSNPNTGAAIYHAYYQDRQHITWFDETYEKEFNELSKTLPGHLRVEHINAKGDRWVLKQYGDGIPPAYYFFDSAARELKKLGDDYADLPAAWVSDKQVVSYPSRDGATIPAYLSLPKQGTKPYAAIVLPHGGPNVRGDYAEFDYWAQYFTAKGYAVLQPAFRGTTGYGNAHAEAGYGEWGRIMQSDVEDGTRWLASAGHADPNRICLVGGSYGGYVAMMGALATPELFTCAVSFAGVSDVEGWYNYLRRFGVDRHITSRIRKKGMSWAQLREVSPVDQAARVRTPLQLIHGDADWRVTISHSERMAKALVKAKIPHEYIVLEDGNHHLSMQRNRLRFFEEIDRFVTPYLQPAE